MTKIYKLNKSNAITAYLGILFVVTTSLIQNVTGQSRCTNPNRNSGYCISIYDCPSLIEVLSEQVLTTSEKTFIKNSQCTVGVGREPFVCCTRDKDYTNTNTQPETTSQTPIGTTTVRSTASNGKGNVLPEPPNCGHDTFADRIYGGNTTALDEYPWMVLLQYVEKSGNRTLQCGGSLINQRYVVTAAHCVKGKIEEVVGPLEAVHLGEYDTAKEIDCIGDDCNNKVVKLGIEQIIPHPEYDPDNTNRHHDIALIRLNKDVTYTDFIKPVCLPLTQTRMAIDAGELLTVAGWGRTLFARQSNIKMKLFVPVADHSTCASKFSKRNIMLIDSQLCAGGDFAKDSCDGDSGGPLMRQIKLPNKLERWYLEGVVSFGNHCGLENWPAVYTKVQEYIPWIQENLRP